LNWQNTPLDGALYGNLPRMIQDLSGLTRDVFRLTWIGNIERLREVLSEEPALAKAEDDEKGSARTEFFDCVRSRLRSAGWPALPRPGGCG
jgi:hypothetical protein